MLNRQVTTRDRRGIRSETLPKDCAEKRSTLSRFCFGGNKRKKSLLAQNDLSTHYFWGFWYDETELWRVTASILLMAFLLMAADSYNGHYKTTKSNNQCPTSSSK